MFKKLLLLFMLIPALSWSQQIAVKNLSPVPSVLGSDITIDDQGGVTKSATMNQILIFIEGHGLFPFASIAPGTAAPGVYSIGTGTTFGPTGTGQVTANNFQGILPIAQGGNGTSSPSLSAGPNIFITGSWPVYQISGSSFTSLPWSSITNGTSAATLAIGTGGTFFATGTGVIAATTMLFSGNTGSTNTNALFMGSGGSLTPTGTGIITASNIYQFAQYSPISLLSVPGSVCDDVTDQSSAFNTLVSAGVSRILIPKHCVVFLTIIPANTELWCEDQTSVLAANPVTGNLDAGALSKTHGCSTINSFENNTVQPVGITKIVAGKDFANMSDATGSGEVHWWSGESSEKTGPAMTGPYRNIGFTSSVGGASSGTVITPNELQGNHTYSLTFSNGQQRTGILTGTTMDWSAGGGALSSGSVVKATVDHVAFTASQGGLTNGNMVSGDCLQVNPGNSPYWIFVFDEGGGVTETRDDVLITAGGGCAGGSGVHWATLEGALASRTILGAQIKSTDLPQHSFVSTATGDNVFFSTNTQVAGTGNAMRVVADANTTLKTGTGSGNYNGIYMFVGSKSFGYGGTGLYIKDQSDGSFAPIGQNSIYIQRIGNVAGAGKSDTSLYIDDANYAGVNPASRPVIDVNTNSQGSGNFLWFQQGTQAYSGDFFHVDAGKTAGAFSGNFAQYNNGATLEYQVDSSGNVIVNGTSTLIGGIKGATPFDCTGTITAPFWGIQGLCSSWSSTRTVTDSTSTGTATTEAAFSIQATNQAFTSATALLNNVELYIPAPGCTTNCSLQTNGDNYSLMLAGSEKVQSNLQVAGRTDNIGTKFTTGAVTGAACTSTNNTFGGAMGGIFKCNGAGTSAVTVVINLPTSRTNGGFSCYANDDNTKTPLGIGGNNTPPSGTISAMTISGTVTSGDFIAWGCTGW